MFIRSTPAKAFGCIGLPELYGKSYGAVQVSVAGMKLVGLTIGYHTPAIALLRDVKKWSLPAEGNSAELAA